MNEVDDEDLALRVKRAKAQSKHTQRQLQAGVRMGAVLFASLILAGILVYLIYL